MVCHPQGPAPPQNSLERNKFVENYDEFFKWTHMVSRREETDSSSMNTKGAQIQHEFEKGNQALPELITLYS
jgi:hypothetical protein